MLVSFGVGLPWVGLFLAGRVIIEESLRVRCRSKIPKEGKENNFYFPLSKEHTPRVHIHPFSFQCGLLSTHSPRQFTHTSPTHHHIMRPLFLARATSNLSRHAYSIFSRACLLVFSLPRSRSVKPTIPLHSQQIQLATTHRAWVLGGGGG